jgi:hypothetical protein
MKQSMTTIDVARLSVVAAIAVFATNVAMAGDASPDNFRVAIGAYHWFNLPRHGGDPTYGTDGVPDTYRWEAVLDGQLQVSESNTLGFHTDVRYRENEPLRSFISSQLWTQELYGFAKTDAGTFKAGQVWSRFGLDWDGSFYGNVQYFDGLKLDPDWGVAWERKFSPTQQLSIDAYAQFFFAEDKVNGSLVGGDAESADNYRERNTSVVRVVPTWSLDEHSSIALGLSGRLGEIEVRGGDSHHVSGGALDITYANRGFKVFAEMDAINGRTNPAHYVTGGPSDAYRDDLAGVEYTFDPLGFVGATTLRYTFSRGEYENPDGTQDLRLVGLTSQLAKWLTLYVEYVNWDVRAARSPAAKYEDGFQFILYWNVGKTFNF